MSDNSDSGLGWLSDGEESQRPPQAPKAKGQTGLDDEVENWLKGSGDAGETVMSPEGAADFMDESLDWMAAIDSNTSEAAPGDETMVSARPIEEVGNESMFSSALDDFFNKIDDKPIDESVSASVELSASTAQRVRDNKVDRIVNTLLRHLTRKDAIRQEQLDSIFRLTFDKVVDAVKAEVVAVYFIDDNSVIVANIFYSKNLFRKEKDKLRKFQDHLMQLDKVKLPLDKGILGKCLQQKATVTSHNVPRDPDYIRIVGEGTAFEVRTMLTVPISDGDELFGAVQLMNKDETCGEQFFSMQDANVIREIASYVGRIVHRVTDPKIVPDDHEMARYISRLSKCDVIDLTDEDMVWDQELIEEVGKENIKKWKILPLKRLKGKRLRAVMINPLEFQRRNGFEAVTGFTVEETVVGVRSEVDGYIAEHFTEEKGKVNSADIENIIGEYGGSLVEKLEIKVDEDENAAPTIKLVNRIIEGAYERGASDIHIEPFEEVTRVRYRVDGVLQEVFELPQRTIESVSSRIKIMSDLDIAERRIPQDGKIKFKQWSKKGLDFDLRVATGPMAFGEKICMRLLVKGNISLGLNAMGFSEQNMSLYRWAVAQPYGMILNVGPTGSGKTTTLYSALTEVSTPQINVHTAEDPIEYPLHGINQMQMQKDIGLTFATALKCFLRMDPDVILVGEIRDLETAEIGIEAALTGHLLFSTLHTNDAAGTVVRFIEMGIEPFMISSSLLLVCAQRLGRRLCKACRVAAEPDKDELEIIMRDPREVTEYYKRNAKGCKKCSNRGHKGRVGIHEILTLNDELRQLINQSASADELKAAALRNKMQTMFQDALWKVKTGVTDLEDVIASIKADGDVAR